MPKVLWLLEHVRLRVDPLKDGRNASKIFMHSITDLPLSSGAKLVLYADNILLYKAIDSPNDVLLLQQDVNLILQWFRDHGLTPKHQHRLELGQVTMFHINTCYLSFPLRHTALVLAFHSFANLASHTLHR